MELNGFVTGLWLFKSGVQLIFWRLFSESAGP